MELLDYRAADGSRHFASLPASASWARLRQHLRGLPGATPGELVGDGVLEGWQDFTCDGYAFTVTVQLTDYWFYAADAATPEVLLRRVLGHAESLLGSARR